MQFEIVDSPEAAAAALESAHFLSVEMMYKPRPDHPSARMVFDAAFRARLAALNRADGVLLLANDLNTLDSLRVFAETYSELHWIAAIVNPKPLGHYRPNPPYQWEWENPARWMIFKTSDRWARIDFAMRTAAAGKNSAGILLMPAHDAVYGRELLSRLEKAAQYYACDGVPAAVSPFAPDQHTPLKGVAYEQNVSEAMNAAFARDSHMRQKLRRDQVQAFWGKMNMLPFALCGAVLEAASQKVWEDDKEIDRAIRDCGYCARALWISDLEIYRQSPPVFTRQDLKRVIARTLHYSLNIPTKPLGASSLNRPLDFQGKLRQLFSPQFRRANRLAETLIRECMVDIENRVRRYGVSWVDWGNYRYVVQVGNPDVEVWKKI
ncbi:MAG: hypothetical protein IAE89_03760 [Anaerolineae bacterium]|nr:hypothetical protein [Anaerolineae bacterium]